FVARSHGYAVVLGLEQLTDRLQAVLACGEDVVLHVRRVVEHRIGAAAFDRQVRLVELLVRIRGCALDVFLDVVGAGRTQAGGHGQPLEVLHALDRGVVDRNTDPKTRLVVRTGEVDHLVAFVGDGDPGDGDIERAGLQTGDDAVEVGRLQFDLEPDPVGHFVDDVDVEADVFAVLLELERHERGIRGHGVGVLDFTSRFRTAVATATAGQTCCEQGDRSNC